MRDSMKGVPPMLPEVNDFREECDELSSLLSTLSEDDWRRPTAFKGWTANDIFVHLHFWNKAADLSVFDSEAFASLLEEVNPAVQTRGLRKFENEKIAERGAKLYSAWRTLYQDMAARWRDLDPSRRAKWGGPDMSVRSMISSRQMETWAHGQALYDLFGRERAESDRLRNIVVLGVNTFGWSFRVRGDVPPREPPRITLTSPQGVTWSYNETSSSSTVRGAAVEFCQVVAQTRNVADTSLQVDGEAAISWLKHPQCFAGPSETPPAPGARVSGTAQKRRLP
jgi:uncharacterized protein (TIGR03084 family)